MNRPKAPLALASISYADGRMRYPSQHAVEPESALQGYIEAAEYVIDEAATAHRSAPPADIDLPADVSRLRWFPLPHEALAELRGDGGAHFSNPIRPDKQGPT